MDSLRPRRPRVRRARVQSHGPTAVDTAAEPGVTNTEGPNSPITATRPERDKVNLTEKNNLPQSLSELLFYLLWLLISFGVFLASGGTETELAESATAPNEQGNCPVRIFSTASRRPRRGRSRRRLGGLAVAPTGAPLRPASRRTASAAAGLPFPAGAAFPPDGLAAPLHAASMAATAIAALVFAASKGGLMFMTRPHCAYEGTCN
jgi:hypothetical protein